MTERIAITNMEMITALGDDARQTAARLIAGEGCLSAYAFPDKVSREPAFAGSIMTDMKQALGGKGWRHYHRAGLMACLVGKRLMKTEADEKRFDLLPEDVGVALGYDHDLYTSEFVETIRDRALNVLNPAFFLTMSTNSIASQLSIYLQIRGFTITQTTGWMAGLDSLYAGAQALKAGRAKMVLAGGVEENTLEKIYSMATGFAATRDGKAGTLLFEKPDLIPTGEGCALMQMERESFAREQGRKPLAFFSGFGMGVNPAAGGGEDPLAAVAAIKAALAKAQLDAGAINAVFLSANGNSLQDRAEAKALATVFSAGMPPAAAVKGALGDTFHADGAIAAGAAVMCAQAGQLPPTLHGSERAVYEQLNLGTQARAWKAEHALVLTLEQDYKAGACVLSFE